MVAAVAFESRSVPRLVPCVPSLPLPPPPPREWDRDHIHEIAAAPFMTKVFPGQMVTP